MAELNVIFDVPEAIAEGLKNGVYERIGGVIRRVGDKQIVMWLQEGVLLERDTAEQLLKQGAEQVQLLRQQAEQLQLLGVQQQMIMGLQVANLAVSVAGFALTLYKLQGIENKLKHMDGKLDDIRHPKRYCLRAQCLRPSKVEPGSCNGEGGSGLVVLSVSGIGGAAHRTRSALHGWVRYP